MPMFPEVKEAWLRALRGGDYPQTKGILRMTDPNFTNMGYCCLGVLCNLAAGAGVGGWSREFEDRFDVGAATSYSFPPQAVLEWAGLGDRIGLVNDLATKNDNGSTFEEIAKHIEEVA